jgi:peptidoglycan hydrolase-like protein with peptidoglycan-binding domain
MTIQKGDKNNDVKALVKILRALNYKKLSATSNMFGPKTKASAKDFQYKSALDDTGIVDAETWKRLNQANNQRYLTNSEIKANGTCIHNKLIGAGWTEQAIAAFLGNTQRESKNNPAMYEGRIFGRMYKGFGLVQWTPASKFIDWCIENDLNPYDIDSQIARVLWEVENGQQWYVTNPMSFSEFTQSTKPAGELAILFEKYYERPAKSSADIRSQYAEAWYSVFVPPEITGQLIIQSPVKYVNLRDLNGKFVRRINNGEIINTTGKIIGKYTEVYIDGERGKVYTSYTMPYVPESDEIAITLYNGEVIRYNELHFGNGYPNTPIPEQYKHNILAPLAYLNMVMQEFELNKDDIFIRGGYRDPTNNKLRKGAKNSRHTLPHVDALDIDLTASGMKKTTAHKIFDYLENEAKLKGGIHVYSEKSIHFDTRGYKARW